MRIPISVAVRLLPIDQLSSGGVAVMPSPYRSAISLPFQVTTNAAVIPSAGSNAAAIAFLSLSALIPAGRGSFGNTLPIGQGWVDASGNLLVTVIGLKCNGSVPAGSVTQP